MKLKGLRALFAGLLASVAGTGDARSADLADPVVPAAQAASRCGALEEELALDLEIERRLRGLTEQVREKTALQTACLLSSLPELERTAVVTSWAVSPRRDQRLVLARASAYPFEAVGLRSALEQLAQDPDGVVREAIASALAHREHAVELDLTLDDGVLRPRGTPRRHGRVDPA